MVGISSSSGGKNWKMRAFFDSPTLDTTTLIASSQLSLLLISKSKPERPGIRCCTKVMHQKGPHMKYAVADSINAALSTYAPTAKQTTPPPSQRVAFPIKEENLDNGHLKIPSDGRTNRLGPSPGSSALTFIWLTALTRVVNDADVVFDGQGVPLVSAAEDGGDAQYRYL